jgi:uncharacterized protein YaaQ
METRGGMLRQAQMTLFIAVQDEDLEKVTHIIQGPSPSQPVLGSVEGGGPLAPMPVKPRPGGAVIFVWNVERSETH